MFGSKMSKVEKAVEKQNAKALIDLAGAKDLELQLAAILGLSKVGGDDTTNYLITKLNDANPQIRTAVAQALGTLGDMHTKAHLSAQIARETDASVREAMSKAMANIKGY